MYLTPCLPGTYTPFLPRPISSFQCYHTLTITRSCKHCTHMTFLSFFCDSFILVVFNHLWVFYFVLNQKNTEN
ncbi:unnamed protein product [Staurois parvus]|uniref:Uncharacterized protein n=1 Tax=Staurois parvus TaxID=386267 RepID=A0ABN9BNA6_9NEOB|nr:unnamed protein product [Staurois parvus]